MHVARTHSLPNESFEASCSKLLRDERDELTRRHRADVRAHVRERLRDVFVVSGVRVLVERAEAEHDRALIDERFDARDHPARRRAFVEVGDDRDDRAPRVLDELPRVVERDRRVVASAELHLHERLDWIGDLVGQVDDLGVPDAQVRLQPWNAPQTRRGHRGVDHRAEHAPALVDEQNELPLLHLRALARQKERLPDHQATLLSIEVAEVLSDRRLRVEVLRELDARAAPRARPVEGVADLARELLHQLADHLADELARHREDLGVHQVLREEHRAEERLARLDALEDVGVRDDLVDLVLLDRVALEALDGLARKERWTSIEPIGHRELLAGASTRAARCDVALLELVAALVEPLERLVGRHVVGAHPRAPIELARGGAGSWCFS